MTGGGGAGLYGYIENYEDEYGPLSWTLGPRESEHHYCFVDVDPLADPSMYTVECKRTDGTVIDSFSATADQGGFAGPTPQDLLDRATEISCGSYVTKALGIRVKDVEASVGLNVGDRESTSSFAGHCVANSLLYGMPLVVIFGLRRRLRRD